MRYLISFTLSCYLLMSPCLAQNPGCPSGSVAIAGNLDASSTILPGGIVDIPQTPSVFSNIPTGVTFSDLALKAAFSTTVTVYDSLLFAHSISVYFFHTAANSWETRAYVSQDEILGQPDSGLPYQVGSVSMAFTVTGLRTAYTNPDFTVTTQWDSGAAAANINFLFAPFTQFATTSSISGSTVGCGTQSSATMVPRLDYDGDGKTDKIVFRKEFGVWFIKLSGGGTPIVRQWGLDSDIPVPGDYDGDKVGDFTVYRPSTGHWITCGSQTNYTCGAATITQFGLPGDRPLFADFDADGTYDFAVWRPSIGYYFYKLSSTGEIMMDQWGLPADLPLGVVPGE